MSKNLLEVAQKLAEDEEFRAEFMADPREYLSKLGLSPATIEQLVPVLLTVLATGGLVLGDLGSTPPIPEVGWR